MGIVKEALTGPPPAARIMKRRQKMPTDLEIDAAIARLERLANSTDELFRVPGTNIKFGLDSIVGLVPGLGDVATALVSVLFITEGARLGIRRSVLMRMVVNIITDSTVGAVPLAGDVFDVAFKSNTKNLALLKREIEKQRAKTDRIDGTAENG
ncbi:DUF4112 domain-containing protein [Stratiformator vulcanicus]|uniref:DUF4112 domain-containing protein n=1 Tax=Stratiformator vulcanicus TaxID=2527980 RepID=A0A517QZU6_9PLAN|nr:DUF4112 domain-containing protein [Stratiformator vulcanicus]QDT37080.1 hypothetical protein Pan189_14470 [Stratiformator vulcanicus]